MRTPDAPKNEILQIALQEAERGRLIFPCHNTSKRPLTDDGLYAATRDTETITQWFTRWPGAMIGIRCGRDSGVFVIDCDHDAEKHVDGVAALKQLCPDLPETITIKTPRGGRHYYFAYPDDGREIRNSAGKIAPGVDVRGEGGYVIAAGSVRSDGVCYELLADVHPGPPPPAPQRLIELCTANNKPAAAAADPQLANFAKALGGQRSTKRSSNGKGYGAAALDDECDRVARAPVGTRNHQLNASAFSLGQLVAGGVLDEGEVRQRLMHAASDLAKDDGAPSIENTITSGLSAGMAQPRGIPEQRQTATRAKGEQKDESEQPPPLPFIDMSKWDNETVPQQQWAVLNRIPLRQCVLFSGEGAAGKSTVELHRSAAHVLGRDWLGTLPSSARQSISTPKTRRTCCTAASTRSGGTTASPSPN